MAGFDSSIGQDTQFTSGKKAAESGRRGGIASGESKRRKRTLRELAETFGAMKVDGKAARAMDDLGIDRELQTRFMQGVVSLFNKAMKGDVAAFNAVRDLIGEKPVDETRLSGGFDTKVEITLVHGDSEPVNSEDEIVW